MFRKDKNFEVVGSLMAMVEQEEKEAENGSKEEPQLVALETRLPGRDVFLHLQNSRMVHQLEMKVLPRSQPFETSRH